MGYIIPKNWGKEEIIEENEHYRIKIITVDSGCRTSLQYHDEKIETHIYLDGKIIHIPPKMVHRICGPATLIEVCHGVDEDIHRLEDDYGRATSSNDESSKIGNFNHFEEYLAVRNEGELDTRGDRNQSKII